MECSPGEPLRTREPVLQAKADIDASAVRVRQWFLDLEEHPERYRFESHAGFTFTGGGFGQSGARFETHERFYGVPARLQFKLCAVYEHRFEFVVVWPPVPVWGAFAFELVGAERSRLSLEVGGTTRAGDMLLNSPLLRGAIQRQIQSEVDHIARSIQSLIPSVSDAD